MRGIALLVKLLAALACLAALGARADEIAVREASLRPAEEGMVLDADFAFEFGSRHAEAIANGVPLYFLVEFELTRPRWYWLDEKTASRRMQVRLSYHVLSRQYRLSTGPLQQNFATLPEALHVLQRVRNWLVVDRTVVFANAEYEAAVRMRLDISQLPKPFQVSALTSREWHLESAWKRFTVRSPQHLPAPVETRTPLEGNAN
jgi:hypothetical protein